MSVIPSTQGFNYLLRISFNNFPNQFLHLSYILLLIYSSLCILLIILLCISSIVHIYPLPSKLSTSCPTIQSSSLYGPRKYLYGRKDSSDFKKRKHLNGYLLIAVREQESPETQPLSLSISVSASLFSFPSLCRPASSGCCFHSLIVSASVQHTI